MQIEDPRPYICQRILKAGKRDRYSQGAKGATRSERPYERADD